jgi:hypothetical protein
MKNDDDALARLADGLLVLSSAGVLSTLWLVLYAPPLGVGLAVVALASLAAGALLRDRLLARAVQILLVTSWVHCLFWPLAVCLVGIAAVLLAVPRSWRWFVALLGFAACTATLVRLVESMNLPDGLWWGYVHIYAVLGYVLLFATRPDDATADRSSTPR